MRKAYRNSDNGDEYLIEYREEDDGTYSIWAIESPRNPYSGNVEKHHLYESGKVCVESSHTPRTMERAIALAVYWMNRYSVYVRTGQFPKTVGRINVA